MKGEEAQWVEDRIAEEVSRNQLERGSSPWGSPAFGTREFETHRRQGKRRLVVEYRRMNKRVLRAVYYLRRADDVKSDVAGSVYMTLLDAVAGFNQVANTERARQVLAVVARSGVYLPRRLTFGPVNGPEDFCYVVDRLFSVIDGALQVSSPGSKPSQNRLFLILGRKRWRRS